MLDRTVAAEEAAYQELAAAATSMSGTNFALLMRQGDSLTVHRRESQPCQGGEMRKYKYTSPTIGPQFTMVKSTTVLHPDCTRPFDERPSDLRHPFPPGIPEGVARSYKDHPKVLSFMKAVVSTGPYQKIGLEGTEFFLNKDGLVNGMIVLNTDVDPTLLVSMFQYINSFDGKMFDKYVNARLTEAEALITMMLFGSGDPTKNTGNTNEYYFPVSANLRRLIDGNPHDVNSFEGRTGTFRQGFDYNRPEVQDIFKARDGEVVTNFNQELMGRGAFISEKRFEPTYKYEYTVRHAESLKSFCSVVKSIFNEALAESMEKAA